VTVGVGVEAEEPVVLVSVGDDEEFDGGESTGAEEPPELAPAEPPELLPEDEETKEVDGERLDEEGDVDVEEFPVLFADVEDFTGTLCDVGAFALDDGHDALIAARVFGPTTPQPVAAGVPEETTPCSLCHCSVAACVSGPK
jgi:hypothetical protein